MSNHPPNRSGSSSGARPSSYHTPATSTPISIPMAASSSSTGNQSPSLNSVLSASVPHQRVSPHRYSSFAAITSGTPNASSRRTSVPSSPSPRIHRASGSFTWGVSNLNTMAQSSLTATRPTAAPTPPPLLPRPDYLELSAFKDIFSPDIFTQSATLSSHNSSATSSSLNVNLNRRSRPAYNYHPMSRSTGSTPSPAASDSEDNELPTARPRDVSSRTFNTLPIRPEGEIFTLPTTWNDSDRHASISISPDGQDLTFMGTHPNEGDKEEAASSRANVAIPPACGVYYYEVEILNKGVKGHIGIGFSTRNTRLNKLPGWEPHSWGYHGDDGKFFYEGKEYRYGPKFGTGDFIGCGINFAKREIFYTHSGRLLPPAPNYFESGMELYPILGLRSARESVRTNFGQRRFKFDIDLYVSERRKAAWDSVQTTSIQWKMDRRGMSLRAETPISPTLGATMNSASSTANGANESRAFLLPIITPSSAFSIADVDPALLSLKPDQKIPNATAAGSEIRGDELKDPLRELVMDYLVQSGYPASARAFKSQCDQERAAADQSTGEVQGADNARLGADWQKVLIPGKKRKDLNGDSSSMDVDLASPIQGPEPGWEVGCGANISDTAVRRRVMQAIRAGDIDSALIDLETYYPFVVRDGFSPEVKAGGVGETPGIRFKLRCRKLVELYLLAASKSANSKPRPRQLDSMDVDSAPLTQKQKQKRKADPDEVDTGSGSMLEQALEFGQVLHVDYGSDKRTSVQALLKRSASLVAYEDPLDAELAGEDIARFTRQEAREELADEVNETILESQRRTVDSAISRIYKQASGVSRQLGVMGEGTAAFTDIGFWLLR